jgi:L-ascorbate metabolism protein UlaG (beta-lactamase superfamily)
MGSAEDLAVLAELESRPFALPAGLEIEWLGVSGYRIACEGRSLYVDPYFSRVPLRSLLLRRTALPDPAALDRYLPATDDAVGVLVGHTHFDHAVDAPAIARRFGCRAYGSGSLTQLMDLHGLAELAVEVEPNRPFELGPFVVTFIRSAHSKLILGLKVPYAGELTCDRLDGLCPSAYKCGQVWGIQIEVAGLSLYHQGSAELLDDELGNRSVDVFLAGIAGRNFSRRYWERILPRLDPAVVVPTHYDDFFRPLDDDLSLIAGAKLGELDGEIAAVSGDARVAALRRVPEQPSE